MLSIAFLVFCLISMAHSEFNLNIRMHNFQNSNTKKHLTYFKFCLSEQANSDVNQCLDAFQTQILGENTINADQFKLTTETVQLKFHNFNSNDKLYLFIKAMNGDNSEVVRSWQLDLVKGQINSHKWQTFQNKYNEHQQLEFFYKIECSKKYHGLNCELPKCSVDCDLTKGGYCQKPNQCICKLGWTGQNCDEQITESRSSECGLDCKNGGVCVINPITSMPMCQCNSDFLKGEFCQIRVVLHTCNLCQNGGSCYANGECLCPPGYAGAQCQIKRLTSQCGLFTCYNGGTCYIDNQNEYACVCHSAFTGKTCNTKVATSTSTMSTQTILTETESKIQVASTTATTTSILSKKSRSSSDEFTSEHIMLIVIIGVGMPIFAVLIVLAIYRSFCIKQEAAKNMMKASTITDKAEKSHDKSLRGKKENIYVSCNNLNKMVAVGMNGDIKNQIEKTKQENIYYDNYSSIDEFKFQSASTSSHKSLQQCHQHYSSSLLSTYSSNIYSREKDIMVSIV